MLVKRFSRSPGARTSFSASLLQGFGVIFCFWPGAEDRALRGRNLSAVFRTLYRQVGGRCKMFPSCAHTWRVENQCDKSTVRTARRLRMHGEHPRGNDLVSRSAATCSSGSLSADIPRRANRRLVVESPESSY